MQYSPTIPSPQPHQRNADRTWFHLTPGTSAAWNIGWKLRGSWNTKKTNSKAYVFEDCLVTR